MHTYKNKTDASIAYVYVMIIKVHFNTKLLHVQKNVCVYVFLLGVTMV